jgi:hypothetical protein
LPRPRLRSLAATLGVGQRLRGRERTPADLARNPPASVNGN